ncbi:MAG: glycosyltransferase family 2 protein [Flavobacterium sp.]|uniref:glycosyltransferase family 2 protein n=1 Tax=Flavobacterium sp. TaxID=239 RepID=UPI00121D0858|nr:glycosyltransferase family A protein [Flavobacterium sp.]RZJ65106.1 MAG: glycosyltransferase family 2 protein [Flavobacterium sp.]
MPHFSIVIPLYNKGNHIEETLRSALSQTFPDFEIIIVNDGSTDDGLDRASSISDDRIKIFTTDNKGVSAARNFGISKSQGEIVAFLDADDTWNQNHLSDLHRLSIEFPTCGLFATAYDWRLNGKIVPIGFSGIERNKSGIVNDFFASSLKHRIAWTSAVAVPKKILDDVGNFNENITLGAGEDLDLWIRIAIKYQVAFCNKSSAIHNLGAQNRMSLTDTTTRSFALLDQFSSNEKNNPSLKKFLDLYRAEFALKMKLANDVRSDFYMRQIDFRNLPWRTNVLLKLPLALLKPLYQFKKKLERNGVSVSAYY